MVKLSFKIGAGFGWSQTPNSNSSVKLQGQTPDSNSRVKFGSEIGVGVWKLTSHHLWNLFSESPKVLPHRIDAKMLLELVLDRVWSNSGAAGQMCEFQDQPPNSNSRVDILMCAPWPWVVSLMCDPWPWVVSLMCDPRPWVVSLMCDPCPWGCFVDVWPVTLGLGYFIL